MNGAGVALHAAWPALLCWCACNRPTASMNHDPSLREWTQMLLVLRTANPYCCLAVFLQKKNCCLAACKKAGPLSQWACKNSSRREPWAGTGGHIEIFFSEIVGTGLLGRGSPSLSHTKPCGPSTSPCLAWTGLAYEHAARHQESYTFFER